MLYQIIIYPIQIILEIIYFALNRIVNNAGLSIIGVSVAIQILTLPLYSMAERWQTVERDMQKSMKPKIDKIKAVFNGDEQYMVLSTYYKQNRYHPIYSMRSTIGLLIQVPFFIAAYTFLNNLSVLQGTPFYIIDNLAKSDSLLTIGSFTINVLPILMTIINVISSIIYTKDFSLREKVQLHVMAVIFLILLYNSPSALVLYWTCNNLFSLIKNCMNKLKKPLKVLYFLACSVMLLFTTYIVFFTSIFLSRKLLVIGFSLVVVSIPLCLLCTKKYILPSLQAFTVNAKERNIIFILLSFSLSILVGAFIPSALTASSPQEFSFLGGFTSPLEIIQFPFFQSIGIFLFWMPLIYFLFSTEIKNLLTWLLLSLFVLALLNVFIFTGNYGNITLGLQFDNNIPLIPTIATLLLDIGIITVVFLATLLLIRLSHFTMISAFLGVALTSIAVLSIMNLSITIHGYKNYVSILKNTGKYEKMIQPVEILEVEPVYNLSKDKENVVIILLDRAIGAFPKYIFEEFPEVKKQFDGFTWYPNTLSAASSTLLTAPSVYGGYEYLPQELDKRETEKIVYKHSESLLMLPVLFHKNGFNSTTTDLSSTSYNISPEQDIFKDWDINASDIMGEYTQKWLIDHKQEDNGKSNDFKILQNRLLFFSMFRIIPSALRGGVYLNGSWWETSHLKAMLYLFVDQYAQLDYLEELTIFTSEKQTFTSIYNLTTHDLIFLQYPNYEPRLEVTDRGENIWNDESTHMHYHANVASFQALGEWLDFLREHDVYNNTRIIIVADHGNFLNNISEFSHFGEESTTPAAYNPLLLVKDFNMDSMLKIDYTFMTNADVPYLATKDILASPINPFTGKLIEQKKENEFTIIKGNWNQRDPEEKKYNTTILYRVKDNLFDKKNWAKVEEGAL